MTTCPACQRFELKFRCNKAQGECDCPKCQGFCQCTQMTKLVSDVHLIWSQIGFDIQDVTEDAEERLEACVDCDHLAMTANALDSHQYWQNLISVYGYNKALKLLSGHVSL